MTNTLHLLKSYRERTGIALQDMASIIGIDTGNLSKIEHGKFEPSLLVLFAYHLILKIPIERLFKNHYPEITKQCLRNALALKDQLIVNVSSPNVTKRLQLLDTIIDRLVELDNSYDE
jgi:transcriptional regulator with XRE-family HTH domain